MQPADLCNIVSKQVPGSPNHFQKDEYGIERLRLFARAVLLGGSICFEVGRVLL